MKPITIAFAAALISGAAASTEQTWAGRISDSACGAKHESGGEMGEAMNDRDCTAACVRGGSTYVLVADGKVYKIANQDTDGLRAHAGDAVRITGELKGDTITVSKVEASK